MCYYLSVQFQGQRVNIGLYILSIFIVHLMKILCMINSFTATTKKSIIHHANLQGTWMHFYVYVLSFVREDIRQDAYIQGVFTSVYKHDT